MNTYAHIQTSRGAKKTRTLASADELRGSELFLRKNALLQIDAIAPAYALLMRFRHGRGRSAHLEGDVI